MDRINEQSSAYYTASFLDKDGALDVPTSASYSVLDRDTGSVIRAETALTPGSSILIHLEPTDTAMLDETSAFEVHILTVIGIYGAVDKVTYQIEFQVDNLPGISSP